MQRVLVQAVCSAHYWVWLYPKQLVQEAALRKVKAVSQAEPVPKPVQLKPAVCLRNAVPQRLF